MDIKSILEEEYSLSSIHTAPINYGLIDRNYKVTATEGTFFFKVYSSISEIAFNHLHNDLRRLKEAEIPVPVEVIRNKVSRRSDSFYALYKFINGERYNSSIDQIKSVARVFAKVVQVGIPKRSQLSTKPLVEELSNIEQKLTTLSWNETLPKEIQEVCQEYCRLSKDVKDKINTYLPEELDSMPLHPDFTERNLLFTGDSVVLLCDWQGYCPRILLDEVSCAFTRFCTNAPFEGHLLEERMLLFKRVLIQGAELIGSSLDKYARSFPWLLIRRQICNTPFRVYGLSGANETKKLLMKALLWSRDFIEWVMNNETKIVGFLLDEKSNNTT